MNKDILNKFTTHLKNTLKQAATLAMEWQHQYINPEHLLYSLTKQRGSIGVEVLNKAGLKITNLREVIIQKNNIYSSPNNVPRTQLFPKFSAVAKKSIEKAALVANQYKHKYIGTEHLLYGLIKVSHSTIKQIFEENNINIQELNRHLNIILKSTSKFPDLTEVFKQAEGLEEEKVLKEVSKTSSLDFFCNDLTDENLQKNIDPIIGREKEINRLIHILSRRTKSNPVLLGDPGVGKTAIVEGLAKKILRREVPDILINKKILTLDLGLVIAGTIYRGEFEGRLKQIIDEIKTNPNIILFIDELHTIIGAGNISGSMDAANILKPALAKGQIRCIGATTLDEYRKHIESDPALERRFQPIIIEEPTLEETMEVLKGIKENYEKYHRVNITDEALTAAVNLSSRYIQDKFLPDKAIDLIDEAASKIKINKKIDNLTREIRNLEEELKILEEKKRKAVGQEKFQEAIALKDREKILRAKLNQIKEKQRLTNKAFVEKVTKKDIAEIISGITKIPLQDLVLEEKEKLLNLEKLLAKKIIGQDEALRTIANFIRRSRAGLTHPDRPIGSFIFLGPSGVGKTETAKVIAQTVLEDENALVRLDMSEFSESFQASKLIGAPAGYVGYKDGTKLTDVVKRKPYSVVLFDEIEKAHPEIFNLLLQILEDGHLTDATGKKINFKNTIIVMTSNIGLSSLNKGAVGFQSDKKESLENYEEIKNQVLKELEDKFKPEFLNRVDKIIVFRPLDIKSAKKIVRLQIRELSERLADLKIKLEIPPKTISFLAHQGFKPEQGARAIRKVIQESIENPLAQKILEDKFKKGDTIKIKIKDKEVVLEK